MMRVFSDEDDERVNVPNRRMHVGVQLTAASTAKFEDTQLQ